MHINRMSCCHLIQVLNTFWRPKHYLCSQMYNPCSNPHTWSWVLGNDQKHKMVKYKWLKWVSFEGSSAELLRKQSCYSSTSRGDTVQHLARMPPESLPWGWGGIASGMPIRGGDPRPDLGEAEIISLGWSGNTSGRRVGAARRRTSLKLLPPWPRPGRKNNVLIFKHRFISDMNSWPHPDP